MVAVQDFFRSGKILKEINVTAITSILKIKSSASVGDFRPIACYPILCKIITKLTYTRLSSVLLGVFSQTQGAFITRRNIISNILLYQDLVKQFRRKNNQVKGLLMKVDLKKPMTRVNEAFCIISWRLCISLNIL